MGILELLQRPWPWYVSGPLIGLTVPLLLLLGNKSFGISSNFRHVCALLPGSQKLAYFRYDVQKQRWSLAFALGLVIGGFVGAILLKNPQPVALSAATVDSLKALGVTDFSGLLPPQLISWQALFTLPGFVSMVGGGFLVGFGARYAGGCTSGHAITGLASLQLPSLVAVCGFFIGGLFAVWVIFPLLAGAL